jgi:hypothetical protein
MATWSAAGSTLLGTVVLVVTLLDILTTVFHPTAQSPVSARVSRAVWYLVERLSRALPYRGRRWLLSWTLPVAVAGLLLLWLLALLVGFALLYAPSMGQAGAFSSTVGRLHWSDAFYLSGLCLTSIGFGDIVPRDGLLRAIAVGEGLCGLLVVGVSVTYVLTVFPILPVLRVLATTLNEETDGQVGAVPMVRRYLAVDSADALTQRCRELATQLVVLAEAHTTHPVLFYAHPKRAEYSFPRVLLVLQGLIALLRYGVRHTDFLTLVRDPRVVGLEETFIAVLRQLGGSLHLQLRVDPDPARERALAEAHARMLETLRQAGLYRDEPATRQERRAYIRFRLLTDPYIDAYLANTGYTPEDLRGDHPPLRGTTAPLADEQEADDLSEGP